MKGTPGAILVLALYFFFVLPLSSRVDRVVDSMNREIIPMVNLLRQREALDAPPIRDLGTVEPNGNVTLENFKVVAVDQQNGRIFVLIPALRRIIPIQIQPETKILNSDGSVVAISDVRTGQPVTIQIKGSEKDATSYYLTPLTASLMQILR